ncbi:MAG: single-stranded-DNA-specific exonuclease RecJ [Desulfovermiculus sp.]|nr:single-stranded-DNA-specific exonuclease RecJ [Desulfovermiculus sp.]
MPLQWTFQASKNGPEPNSLVDWADALNISPFLARLLWRRGVCSLSAMDRYLSPGLRHLPRLETWPTVIKGAEVLAEGINRGLRVGVWGDYDVDGITATALLVDFFRCKGVPVCFALPDRFEDGYGLTSSGVEALAAQGVGVLLTVDCGIADGAAIARARELGMLVVVSDHHLPGPDLPPAQAIVDPVLEEDCSYAGVAGVGVAFLLMAALNRLLPGEPVDVRQSLDLVALGTIADVVPLTGVNRILVKNGLLVLGEGKRPGIFALKEVSKLPPTAPMGSGQVGFGLAPRINAAGRLASPREALDLLLAPDLSTARPLAAQLEKYNQMRRSTEKDILGQALKQAEEHMERMGVVLCADDWHQGVIGIVASRVVEYMNRPALLLTAHDQGLKGSGRSIPDFDLHQGLCSCAHLLTRFGGHRQAAGLTLDRNNLESLRAAFDQAVRDQLGENLPPPSLQVEARLGLDMVDLRLVQEIDLLQPFGLGNPQPVFCSTPLRVQKHKVFGSNHVSLQLRDDQAGVTMLGKAWRQADLLSSEVTGQSMQLAFTPRMNYYNGLTSIDLQIRDWQCLAG